MASSVAHLGYSEEGVQDVFLKAPYREKEIATLLALFGSRDDLSCPSIFVYGNTATGKSFVVKMLMNTLKVSYG